MRTLTDLRKLRHVVEVARAGSFTAASTTLAVTQSTLTKSVAEVERLLGISLFERLPRGVALTPAGQTFVPRAQRILTDTEDLMDDLAALQSLSRGRLRLGVAPAGYVSFLESTLSAFARVYPGLSISVTEGAIADMVQAALNGQVDLVVGSTNYLDRPDIKTTTVAELHSFVIARAEHPLTEIEAPAAADILRYPLIMPESGIISESLLADAYAAAELAPQPPQYVCDYFPLVRQLVLATDAISPVVSLAPAGDRFRDDFAVFDAVIMQEDQYLGVAQAAQRAPSPAAQAFTQIFQSFLQDASG